MSLSHEISFRVRYAETDRMGQRGEVLPPGARPGRAEQHVHVVAAPQGAEQREPIGRDDVVQDHDARSTSVHEPRGSTRARFAAMPPPVTCERE